MALDPDDSAAGPSLRRPRRRRRPPDAAVRQPLLPERPTEDRRRGRPDHVPEATAAHGGYDLDEALPGFFDRFALAMDARQGEHGRRRLEREQDALPVLTFARYMPSRYLKAGAAEAYEVQVAGLLRSALLKRFESSSCAFARTCRKMAASHDDFLALIATGSVATGQDAQRVDRDGLRRR